MFTREFWVLIDIGCIKCGGQSELLGIYGTEARALDAFAVAAKEYESVTYEYRDGILNDPAIYKDGKTSFMGGAIRYARALEIHRWPPVDLEVR